MCSRVLKSFPREWRVDLPTSAYGKLAKLLRLLGLGTPVRIKQLGRC